MSEIDFISTQVNYLNINSNRSFTYIKEHKETTFWVQPKLQTFHYNTIDNRIYKLYNDIIYKSCCKFIYDDDKFCTNFDCCDGYCDKHLDGKIQYIISDTKIGDISEKYILDILSNCKELINVKLIGNRGYKLDIIYQVKEELDRDIIHYRGIQIKTISNCDKNYPEKLYLPVNKEYDYDTLMVGINREQNRFCLIYYCNTNTHKLLFPVDFKQMKKSNDLFLYTDINLFSEQLINMAKTSTIFDWKLTESNMKEKITDGELERQCILEKLSFEYYNTMDSDIDLIINNKNIQCKSSSRLHEDNIYFFGLQKFENCQHVPYSEKTEVDFFIFTIIQKINEENTFIIYIIPKVVLNYLGYLSSNIYPGKIGITIHTDEYKKYSPFKQFKNRFDLLRRTDVIKYEEFNYCENNMMSRFLLELSKNNIEFIRDNSNAQTNCGFIGNNYINLTPGNTRKRKTCIRCEYPIKKPVNNVRKHYNFFIYEENTQIGNFLIIPFDELIKHNYFDINCVITRGTLTINTLSEIPKDNWIYQYINNFDILK